MKLHVIAVAYKREIPLEILINCFMVQTSPDWELYVIHDTQPSIDIELMCNCDKRVHLHWTDKRNNQYGHPNRSLMLKRIVGNNKDFVLLTNDDNYYVPTYVEQMLSKADDNTGIIYCDTLHSHHKYTVHHSQLKEHKIDCGALIVRYDIAKQTGFNHVHYSADGKYAEECYENCIKQGLTAQYIPKPLFIHN